MSFVIWIIGWLITVEGILLLIKPQLIKPVISFFNKGKRTYLIGLIRTILAIIFFLAAQQCRIPLVITILGITLLVSGIICFVLKPDKLKSILSWWLERPPLIIRLMSIIVVAFGALIVFSALR
ncbi:MAG: hypothetical protein ACYSSI_02985 [Planctomycetota bacterium]|jgi:uncharacterized protein YjeT (DUF2065 family)